MNAEPRKHSRGLALFLYMLIAIYVVSGIFLYFGWQGLQSVDTMAWRRDIMPFYAFLALVGAGSAFAVLKWKRAGVYSLAATWIATGVLNVVFVRPIPYSSLFFGVVLVIAFFLLLLPAWKRME